MPITCLLMHICIQVNTNGVISFINPVPQFSPDQFPIKDRYLISPYWADVDIRGIGNVYFKESTDPSLLARANDVIQSATTEARRLSRFRPRWMLIATWDNVGYFSTHTDMVNVYILIYSKNSLAAKKSAALLIIASVKKL